MRANKHESKPGNVIFRLNFQFSTMIRAHRGFSITRLPDYQIPSLGFLQGLHMLFERARVLALGFEF
jgi:hypothetical protein